MSESVGVLEQNVQTQLAETAMRIHGLTVDAEGNKENSSRCRTKWRPSRHASKKLEQGQGDGGPATTDTKARGPALIMGGFHPDTEADKVVEQVTKFVETLRGNDTA